MVKTWDHTPWSQFPQQRCYPPATVGITPPDAQTTTIAPDRGIAGIDPARPGSERTVPPFDFARPDAVLPIAPPTEVQIIENPSAQVLLFEAAADAIIAVINSKPQSPTRDEIIAALKGIV